MTVMSKIRDAAQNLVLLLSLEGHHKVIKLRTTRVPSGRYALRMALTAP